MNVLPGDETIIIANVKAEAELIVNRDGKPIIAIDEQGNIGTLGQIFMNDGQS